MTPETKAEAIRCMKMTEGWSLLESYITTKKGYHSDQLMTVTTMENIIKHRASIKALDGLLGYMNHVEEDQEFQGGD